MNAKTLRDGRTLMRWSCGSLKDYWYVAAKADEISAKAPFGCQILEERVVLYRKKDGGIVALRDRCLHRNAKLSEGDVFDDCLGCPYHGWTYDARGECVNIPAEGPEGAEARQFKLEVFPTLERYGLVWVWMGGPDAPPDKEPFQMPFWDAEGWGAYYMVTDFDNGVTSLVENFMDVPHTVFVHKGWFRSRTTKAVEMSVERTDSSVLVTYDQPADSIGFSGRILNPKNLPMLHTDKFYMPNVTRVDYLFGADTPDERGFVITSQCTPLSPLRSRVYTLISYKLGTLANVAGGLFLPWYTRRVIQQDVEIMANQGDSLRHYGADWTSTPADTLHVFIESLREHAESGGVGPAPEPTTKQVTFWI